MIAVKLRDVEQQLLRITGVVQLHVTLTDAALKSQNFADSIVTDEEVRGLVDSVQRANDGLQNATQQLLALINGSLTRDMIDSGSETEDENFELESHIKVENIEVKVENMVDTEVYFTNMMEVKQEPEHFTRYISGAKKILDIGGKEGFGDYARKTMLDLGDNEISMWKELVESSMAHANTEFLERLGHGDFEKSSAGMFVEATKLAVALILSRRVEFQEHKWLVRVYNGLFDIVEVGKNTELEAVLSPVVKCYSDLISFCSFTAIEDMSGDVELGQRQFELEANHLFSHFKIVIEKFVLECANYLERYDKMAGQSTRTAAEWKQFGEIGLVLTKWIQIITIASIPLTNVDMHAIGEKLRAFDVQFPSIIPPVLLKNLLRLGEDEKVSKQDTVAVAGSETSQSEVSPELFTYNPLNRMKSTSRRARKRKRSSSVRNQLIATQQRNEIANHSDARRSSDAVVKDMKQLSLYLEAAEEAKQAMQSMADPQSSNVGTPMADLVVVTKWHSAVKVYFKRSSLSFSSLIRSEKMNMDMASAFSEATALAVSLITTSSTSEGRKFSRSWICGAVVILNDVHKQAKESRFTEVLVPVYHSICALLQYCNKRFPNWPRDTMDFVRHVEATESEDISVDRLESVITDLAEHFSRDCVYCLMIHETGNTALWNDIQWETLIQAGWFLANWIELALECSNLQPNWLNAIQGTLNVVERAFPGRLPQLLLELCNVKRISMFTDQTDAQDGVVSSSADALPGNDTASDSLKGDIGRPISKLKRVKLSKDLPTDIQEQTKALFCTAKELSQNFEAREEIESFTKEIGKIQRFLGSALLVNKMLIVSLRLGHPDIASDFAGATAILTDLICRCPSASLEYHQLKGLLRQYISILQMCRNKTGEPIDTLSKSVEKLQWYWDKFVADPFQTMRNHVEATERLSEELTPQLLEYPMRQLLCQYRNACIFSEDMFAQSLISIQVRQCRAGLMEIGLMLNRWVQHTLEAGAQIQKPPGLPKLLAQLINIEVKVPGSIPEPLVENLKRLNDT